MIYLYGKIKNMNLARFVTFSLFVLIFCQFRVFAQRDSVRVRVFDGSEQPPTTYSSSYDDKNYLRMNLYLIARGAFVLGYERILHNKHALSIDAGFTYRDFIYEFATNDADFEFEDVQVDVGHYLEIGYKFYPKDYQDFDGTVYLSPGFISRAYNISQEVVYNNNAGNNVIRSVDVGYGMNDAFLKLGYVTEGRLLDELIADIYVGFGYRQTKSNSYEVTDNTSGSGQELRTYEKIKNAPSIYLGARIGFSF
jgi:hypothetical protein